MWWLRGKARGLQALLLEVILAVRLLHMRHPLLGTTCGLLRKNLVLKHQADVYQRKQITDCLFKLLATTFSSHPLICLFLFWWTSIFCRIIKISWWIVFSVSFYVCEEEKDAGVRVKDDYVFKGLLWVYRMVMIIWKVSYQILLKIIEYKKTSVQF